MVSLLSGKRRPGGPPSRVAAVNRDDTHALLTSVAAGEVPVETALKALGDGAGFTDLGFARVDTHRAARTGDPEVVYGAGKTPEQLVAIVRTLRAAHPDRPALVTRVTDAGRAALADAFDIREDRIGRCVAVGDPPPSAGVVTVVCAGTSDLPVAAEAAFVTECFGAGVRRIHDVGVAGIHRLLAVRPELDSADCVIVVAGMDGALPSAVGGLTGVPVVAVPTSVGYGAAFGGLAPLLSMLNSCAPGVVVCNIDNGFGAGVFAARVARRSANATRDDATRDNDTREEASGDHAIRDDSTRDHATRDHDGGHGSVR
jgi:NCAIR mutase (PurE)-related protein